jgi:hypothetical protein
LQDSWGFEFVARTIGTIIAGVGTVDMVAVRAVFVGEFPYTMHQVAISDFGLHPTTVDGDEFKAGGARQAYQ